MYEELIELYTTAAKFNNEELIKKALIESVIEDEEEIALTIINKHKLTFTAKEEMSLFSNACLNNNVEIIKSLYKNGYDLSKNYKFLKIESKMLRKVNVLEYLESIEVEKESKSINPFQRLLNAGKASELYAYTTEEDNK